MKKILKLLCMIVMFIIVLGACATTTSSDNISDKTETLDSTDLLDRTEDSSEETYDESNCEETSGESPHDKTSEDTTESATEDTKAKEAVMLDILDRIYNSAEESIVTQLFYQEGEILQGEITEDTCSSYFGIALEYEVAFYSEIGQEGAAYSLCLLKVKKDSDIDKMKTAIEDNAPVNKWVCVGAEKVAVESNGSYIVLIMGRRKEVQLLKTAFLSLDLD